LSASSRPFSISHRDIWRIALPASLAFITEPLVGIVDITVIGRLGDAGLLGGLELGTVTFSLVFSLVFFLRLGTAGLTAQSVGAREQDQGLTHLIRAAILGLGIGLVLLLLSVPIQILGLWLFAPPGPSVATPFLTYLQIRMFSAPFVLLNFAFLGWFYGRGAARSGMFLQMGLNALNIIFSVWFVYGLGWGVAGVAWGTVIAQAIIVVFSSALAVYQAGGFRVLKSAIFSKRLLEAKALWRLFALSRDLLIRSAALMGAFVFFSAQMSRSGEIVLASSAVLLNFLLVTAFFLDGQAQAAEHYCGKAVGANYRPAFEEALKLSMLWGLVIGFGLFLFWIVAGPVLIDLMTTNKEVQQMARQYLFVAALISFTGVVPFVMDGVMTGATLHTIIRNGMAASFIIYIIAALILNNLYGLIGLWVALHIFFIARGVIFWFAVRAKLSTLFNNPPW